ncbi:TonB-dependent receptor [Aquimarina sp. TRL1]|uniref:TonB-dependent receptor n=1 Tax=Aquimarina sp. (strain TRL1) TaxID=2736252 RepID=UPI0015894427|nr:TonB-dependent receptor [Aquimarina sp. TRL1]QKX04909.1 TonB-dependent receptor [Aquimarina sp. TRL1]
MRLFTLSLLMFVFMQTIMAQKIKVLNKTTRQPISNVAIYNKQKEKSTITDFDGMADISDFEGTELLYFTHVSHQEFEITKEKIIANGNVVYLETDENKLSEVVISISKWEEDEKDVSQKIVSIRSKDIALATPQTSADLLQGSGQVFIQKSQLGGGSPMIRGFSTNRLLITVDGVRMNNAIFRGGNVQNVISIDPFSIERTEVILGPGSVVYGSDAIGGVMNFYSSSPRFSKQESPLFNVNAVARYASASEEKTAHFDVNIGLKKWAFLTSVSYTDFDDLKMGSHGPEEYLRNEYVEVSDGVDKVVANSDPETQIYTGYNQINFLQKISFKPNKQWDFDAGLVYTTTSDYPRYDRLIRRRKGSLRSAEWYYGPQKWLMGNIHIEQHTGNALYDKMKLTAAYQHFEESRNDRDFGKDILGMTEEQVEAYSFNMDFEKRLAKNTLFYYGGEYVFNKVSSIGLEKNIRTEEVVAAPSRYPDGSTWQSIAAYLSIKHRFSEKVRLNSGLRYNQILLKSEFDNTFFEFPFNEAAINTGALTGSAGISWLPNEILNWKLNFSTAFRSPNVDDIGKVFDSEPGAVVVPNPDLNPEYSYTGELGVRAKLGKAFVVDLATYYTHLDDALVRRDFLLNGESEIIYKGEPSRVQAIQNAARAKIYGFEAGVQVSFAKYFKLTSQYTITGGEEELDNGTVAPSRHVAPQFGNTHLVFNSKSWTIDAFTVYNGTLKFDDLSPSEQNKEYLYAIDGEGNPYSPSWYTVNLRTQYKLSENLQGTFAIENITDQRYRPYSSGIAAAGRNFIVSMKYSL